jgi:hypothetical protein
MTLSPLRIASVACAFVLFAGLVSCTNEAEQEIPEGVQTLTGTLVPISLSIKLRGTHALTQGGKQIYLVESAKTDLRDFEGVGVVVTGIIERNLDPKALPVLVASGVTLIDRSMKPVSVEALKLTLDVPHEWNDEQFDDGVQFTESGSNQIMLKIHTSTLTQLPVGMILQVANRKAVRTVISGTHAVYVQNGRDILSFSYTPIEDSNEKVVEADFLRILRSVRFSGQAASSRMSGGSAQSMQTSSSVSASVGAPCGGAAGILCPSGQYCEITDPTIDSGRCASLKR